MSKIIKSNDNILISTSILNISNNIEKIKKIDETSTDFIHLDIMDGLFVPNKCEYLNKINLNKKVDIHLMVQNVEEYVLKYKDYKPEFITFHYENNEDKIWDLIKYVSNYSKVGIAINPSTCIESLIPYLNSIDLVLVMSVKAGMGGQEYIDISSKIDKLVKLRKENDYAYLIEVDGGINIDTVNKCKETDILVIGSYITNTDNYEAQILNIKNKLKK